MSRRPRSAQRCPSPACGVGHGGRRYSGVRGRVHEPCAGDPGAEAELQPLALEQLESLRGDFIVHAGQDAVEEFQHGHLGTEPRPDGAQFQADIARSDHHQVLRDLGIGEGFGARADAVTVELDAAQRSRFAAGGDEDVLGLELSCRDRMSSLALLARKPWRGVRSPALGVPNPSLALRALKPLLGVPYPLPAVRYPSLALRALNWGARRPRPVRAFRSAHRRGRGRPPRAWPAYRVILFFLNSASTPFVSPADHLVFPPEHGRQVQLDGAQLDAVGRQVVLRRGETLAGLQQGLAGDAPDPQARARRGLPPARRRRRSGQAVRPGWRRRSRRGRSR